MRVEPLLWPSKPSNGPGPRRERWTCSRSREAHSKDHRVCGRPLRRTDVKWWQIKKRDADLERELRSDLELEEEEQREGGVSGEEARYAALRTFGNPTLIREQTRAIWSWSWLESLARDLRYGFRGMRRNAGS